MDSWETLFKEVEIVTIKLDLEKGLYEKLALWCKQHDKGLNSAITEFIEKELEEDPL